MASLEDEINKLKEAVNRESNECGEFDDLPVGLCSSCAQHGGFVPIHKPVEPVNEIVSISKQQVTNSDSSVVQNETIVSSTKITSSSSSSSSTTSLANHQPATRHVHQHSHSPGHHHNHHHHHSNNHHHHQHQHQQQPHSHNHYNGRCQLLPPTPDGKCPIHFGNLYKQNEPKPELYGDVYALKYVDLDKYGLGQYKDFISSL